MCSRPREQPAEMGAGGWRAPEEIAPRIKMEQI